MNNSKQKTSTPLRQKQVSPLPLSPCLLSQNFIWHNFFSVDTFIKLRDENLGRENFSLLINFNNENF